jgi:hypothetical protein
MAKLECQRRPERTEHGAHGNDNLAVDKTQSAVNAAFVAADKPNAANLRVGAVFPTGSIVPDFPELPREVVERFPELKAWQIAVKKWQNDFTTILRNTR